MALRKSDPPLDEVQWRAADLLRDMGGIHSNSVLMYFAYSPFCDPTSNNKVIMSQALYNPRMLPIVATREAFESHIKSMGGLEYVVAQEPAETAPGTGTGVWVIRKQNRRLRPASQGGDEITILETYFVVGENIYMAPALADILSSRLLSMTTSITKFVNTASSLPDFSPAFGHTYLHQHQMNRPKPDSQLNRASKENTPLPDSMIALKKAADSGPNTSSYLETRLLAESLDLSLRYGEEYMDENPITGHPGEFHLSSTGRKDKTKLAIPAVSKVGAASQGKTTAPPTPETRTREVPAPVRKGSKGDKSPRTPGMPKPKRRKSKAVTSTVGATGA